MSDTDMRNTPTSESFRTRLKESGQALKRKAEKKLDKLIDGSVYINDHSFGVLQSLNNTVSSWSSKRKRRGATSRKGTKKKG